MIRILAPWSNVRPVDRVETDLFLAGLPAEFEVIRCETAQSLTYYEFLMERWRDSEDWLIVEHDIVPTVVQLLGLAICPEPFCTVPYLLAHGRPCIGYWRLEGKLAALYLQPGPEWALFSGFGCVKLGAQLRLAVKDPPPPHDWDGLDQEFSHWLNALGYRWHVHPGMAVHHHAL